MVILENSLSSGEKPVTWDLEVFEKSRAVCLNQNTTKTDKILEQEKHPSYFTTAMI